MAPRDLRLVVGQRVGRQNLVVDYVLEGSTDTVEKSLWVYSVDR